MSTDPLADFDAEILHFLESTGVPPDLVRFNTPPEREYGERATNVAFLLARERRRAPREIAQELAGQFDPAQSRLIARVEAAGAGFINFYLNYEAFVPHVVRSVHESGPAF